MRELDRKWAGVGSLYRPGMTSEEAQQGYTQASADVRQAWYSLDGLARSLYDELLQRVPQEVVAKHGSIDDDNVYIVIQESGLAGPHPLSETASYIDKLAQHLPSEKGVKK